MTTTDAELDSVAREILRLDPDGSRTGQVLRNTLDQLYDGQRTGRYRWDQLFKTEKTHCGTLVEINLHREFEFMDGEALDYLIDGIDVDCKYSQRLYGWMIPPEALNHICLLVWAEDTPSPLWNLGLVRVTSDRLNRGGNRDQKATLNGAGRNAIRWLFQNAPMPPNVLLQLEPGEVERVFALKSGQQRVLQLFRAALGRRIGRAAVATVAQQIDYMKRIRGNGGARSLLQPEGIVILGQYKNHLAVARSLGLQGPGPGESLPVRLCPSARSGPGVAEINGKFWRIAQPNDPVVPAPKLPEIGPKNK